MVLMFWRLGLDDNALYNRMGAYWFINLITTTNSFSMSLLVFLEMKSVFIKEK